jgi:ribosomal protein S18 acetylase RimI-like enzyme
MPSNQEGREFRRLTDAEVERGYAVIVETVAWLLAKGITQWQRPLPRAVYDRRQGLGQNCGLFIGGELAVVLSLLEDDPSWWADFPRPGRAFWLATLATANAFGGQDLARVALQAAMADLAARGVVYFCLDCVHGNGFLERFYATLGFERLTRQMHIYPTVGAQDVALMRRKLP